MFILNFLTCRECPGHQFLCLHFFLSLVGHRRKDNGAWTSMNMELIKCIIYYVRVFFKWHGRTSIKVLTYGTKLIFVLNNFLRVSLPTLSSQAFVVHKQFLR